MTRDITCGYTSGLSGGSVYRKTSWVNSSKWSFMREKKTFNTQTTIIFFGEFKNGFNIVMRSIVRVQVKSLL
jgi:hypothetical protein